MSKNEVITFKVDQNLASFLKSLPNCSEYIRNAIMDARKHSCPLCRGKGFMNDNEMNHLKTFLNSHTMENCKKCRSVIIKCGV